MGAADFQTTEFGKTARDAFVSAREEALYKYGHGGYTGSIAEKHSFEEVVVPPRYSPLKFVEWASYCYDDEDMKKEKVPKDHWNLVKRMNRIYDDKHGPALCLKVTGKWAKELRKRNPNLKGRKGDFYIFCGFASE